MRRPAIAVAVALLVLAGLAGAAVLLLGGGEGDADVDGVGEASACEPGEERVVVHLHPDSDEDDLAEVAELIAAEGLRVVRKLDARAAFEEFVARFGADSPELVASVRPGDVPSSVVADGDPEAGEALEVRLADDARVREVVAAACGVEPLPGR